MFDYIEVWYASQRQHASLCYRTRAEYEKVMLRQSPTDIPTCPRKRVKTRVLRYANDLYDDMIADQKAGRGIVTGKPRQGAGAACHVSRMRAN